MEGIKRKASVVLCVEPESSASAVQSMELLSELLMMMENEDQDFFPHILYTFSAAT